MKNILMILATIFTLGLTFTSCCETNQIDEVTEVVEQPKFTRDTVYAVCETCNGTIATDIWMFDGKTVSENEFDHCACYYLAKFENGTFDLGELTDEDCKELNDYLNKLLNEPVDQDTFGPANGKLNRNIPCLNFWLENQTGIKDIRI